MPDVGLFYGSCTGNCASIARLIANCFLPVQVATYDILHTKSQNLNNYPFLIFGVPSWNRHQLQDDWDDFLPKITEFDFTNKKVAIYGLGDQLNYPNNFLDGMGRLYNLLSEKKVTIVGQWPTVGYNFRKSQAIQNGKFVGLALDEDSQSTQTHKRVNLWVEQLKKEFEIKI